MAKSKKRKKKDRGGKKTQPITASAIGNPEPATEANGKNESKTDGNNVKVNESKKKPMPTKAPPKTIIGFGSKGKSTTVHAVTDVDNSALCDVRIKDIEVVKGMNATEATCKSCARYATFKQLLATTESAESPPAETPKKAPPRKTKKQTLEEKAAESSEVAALKELLYAAVKRAEDRIKKFLVDEIDRQLNEMPDFFIVQVAKDQYGIIHNKSRLEISRGLSLKHAEKLLMEFHNLEYKWDGKSKVPQEFMAQLREASQRVNEEMKSEPKPRRKLKRRKKTEKAEKPKRKLKRRSTTDGRRVIKRRNRHS